MSDRASVRVGDFLPSRHGFHFSNDFPCGPVVTVQLPGMRPIPFGNAACGLCGGMAFSVRDYYDSRRVIPERDQPPEPGSPLFNYLVRRLWDSFRLPGGPIRYYDWMRLSDATIWDRTLHHGWPRLKKQLDLGRLTPLGFNRYRSRNPLNLGHNHQVLAYGYEWDRGNRDIVLRIYDPDFAGEDELTLRFNVHDDHNDRQIVYSKGSTMRGLFDTPYSPPGFAWFSYLFSMHQRV